MTREEAIIQLRLGPGIYEDVSEKYNDAVNIAIETLEREKTSQNLTKPNKSDLISRKDAIDAMVRRHKDLQSRLFYDLANGVGEAIEVIKELPEEIINTKSVFNLSEDLISREEVKKQTTKKNSIWNTITDSSGRGLDEILDSIPSAPSTDRPKEYWTKYSDNIYNPSHYTDREIEAITYIRDKLTAEQFVGFRIGNVIKYISRYRLKGRPAKDLQKALVYLDWVIEELKKL